MEGGREKEEEEVEEMVVERGGDSERMCVWMWGQRVSIEFYICVKKRQSGRRMVHPINIYISMAFILAF